MSYRSFAEEYRTMIGRDQSPKTAGEEQIQKHNSTQPPKSEENEQGQDSERRTGSNVSMYIVGITCGVVAVVAIVALVAVAIGLSYRYRRHTGSISFKGENLIFILNVLTTFIIFNSSV